MAELVFFATEQDHERIVSALIEKFDAIFVLDGGDSLPLRSFSKVSDVMAAIREDEFGARFFVIASAWQTEALVTSKIDGAGGSIRYCVAGRYGGPSIDYIARYERESDTGAHIICSSLAVFPTYYLSDGEVPRPEALQDAFAELRKFVHRGSKKTLVEENGKAGPIAMTGARMANTRGTWLRIGGWRHVPAGETGSAAPNGHGIDRSKKD